MGGRSDIEDKGRLVLSKSDDVMCSLRKDLAQTKSFLNEQRYSGSGVLAVFNFFCL